METPIKMDDLGVPHLFSETPISTFNLRALRFFQSHPTKIWDHFRLKKVRWK